MATFNNYAWLRGGSAGTTAPVYVSNDGITWTLFRGDDGSGTGLTAFWVNEFLLSSAVFTNNFSAGRLYFTTDGSTWTLVPTFPPITPSHVAITKAGVLVAISAFSGNNQFSRSVNNGSTWSAAVALPGQTATTLADEDIIVDSKGNLWVTGWDQTGASKIIVWKSTDDGITWSIAYTTTIASGLSTMALTYKKTRRNNDVLLLIYSPTLVSDSVPPPFTPMHGGGLTIVRSIDFGATWQTVFNIPTQGTPGTTPGPFAYRGQIGHPLVNTPSYCSNGDWLLFLNNVIDTAGDVGHTAFRSTDDGSSWNLTTDSLMTFTGNGAGAALKELCGIDSTASYTIGSIGDASLVPNKIYTSFDGGHTWTQFTGSPWNTTTYSIQRLFAAPPPLFPNPNPGRVTGLPVDIASPRLNQTIQAYAPVIRVY